MRSVKQHMTEGTEQPNQEKSQRKGNLQIVENIKADSIKQVEMKEKKIK